MSSDGIGGELSPAAEAFADFLARVEDGEVVDFDAFVAARPELAVRLRAMHARWQALDGAFAELDEAEDPPAIAAVTPQEGAVEVEPADASRSQLLRDLNQEDAERPRYSIEGEFARGGMAAILLARDRSLRRTLAMKVLLTERRRDRDGALRSDPRSLARFLEEAQITGQLDHPGIPTVHELGIDGDGRVFFTMPLIRGRNLSEIYELLRRGAEGWTLPRTIGVLHRVCETVAYAHSRGVVHRDLKPANVMVGRFGETYVMDWGLARVLGRDDPARAATDAASMSSILTARRQQADDGAQSPLITLDGHVIGTPAYMAPEQARGELERVGPAADVYSIGAMLYELLAGRMPHVPPGVKLSARTVLARVIEGPPTPLRELDRGAPPELVAICERAMAREPEQRYANVRELGHEFRAWLEGRVVRAYATGTWIELRKWIGRNRALSATGFAFVIAMAIALVVTIVLGGKASRTAARLADELRTNNIDRGRLFARADNIENAERLLWQEHLRTPTAKDTHWALWDLHARHPCLATHRSDAPFTAATLFADGATLAVGDDRGAIVLLDARSLTVRATLEAPDASPVTALAMPGTPDRLISAHQDGGLYVWRLADGVIERDLRLENRVTALARHPREAAILAAAASGELLLLDCERWTHSVLPRHGESGASKITWSANGERYASMGEDRWVHVFDARTGARLLSRQSDDGLGGIALSGDGALLLRGGNDRYLTAIDVATGVDVWRLPKSDSVRDIATTADGERLLVCGWQHLDSLSMAARTHLRSLAVPELGLVLVDAAGSFAVTVHRLELRAWDLADAGRREFGDHTGRVTATVSRDGRWLASGDGSGAVRLCDLAAGGAGEILTRHAARVRCVAFSADGRQLLTGSIDGTLRQWDLASQKELRSWRDHDDQSRQSACFSPDGRRIAMAVERGRHHAIVVVDAASGDPLLEIPNGEYQVIAIAFRPDGEELAFTSRRRTMRFFDLRGR
ncbi:MAG: protein kinase, partial [Planctomycetes bacterium]|nr:protein kinase [Planctomycetota bacterium]